MRLRDLRCDAVIDRTGPGDGAAHGDVPSCSNMTSPTSRRAPRTLPIERSRPLQGPGVVSPGRRLTRILPGDNSRPGLLAPTNRVGVGRSVIDQGAHHEVIRLWRRRTGVSGEVVVLDRGRVAGCGCGSCAPGPWHGGVAGRRGRRGTQPDPRCWL